MKDRGILFRGRLVNALLFRKKTQTRRLIKPQPHCHPDGCTWRDLYMANKAETCNAGIQVSGVENFASCLALHCPYGPVGRRLWVRESIRYSLEHDNFYYVADSHGCGNEVYQRLKHKRSVPSIHMPRWASRLTLEVTNVRAQRLHEITEEDAVAEGCVATPEQPLPGTTAREQFSELWNTINDDNERCWAASPWVWAITFKVLP